MNSKNKKIMLNDNRKTEIIYIPVENLLLDNFNPRLAGENTNASQEDIIGRIYNNEELEELAGSLAIHGFLPEEPIIVIPIQIEDFQNIDRGNVSDYKFIIIEGNRRISSVKLLTNNKLRTNIEVDNNFPQITNIEVEENLKRIPAIIYKERKNVDAYLGIRHIAGNRKWDAYAKAKYIYDKVEECRNNENATIPEAIEIIKNQISDRKDTIRKLYVYYKVFNIIEQEVVNYQSKHIKDRFSLIQVALGMGRTPIAEYIGLPAFSNVDFEREIIDNSHINNLKDITKWIFGLKEDDSARIISDSRNIGKLLAPVLSNKESTDYLKKYGDLAGAYELTNGEEELVRNSLRKAFKSLSLAQNKIYKYKDISDIKDEVDEIGSILQQIRILMKEE